MPNRRWASGLAMLADILAEHYPSDHELIIYEAATLPLCEPKIEKVMVKELKLPGVRVVISFEGEC